MALLQSGKIFYINCGIKDYIDEHGSSYTMQQYYNWFIQQFADVLNITDSEYNRNMSTNTFTFFLLPYINKSTNEKLALRYDVTGLEIVKALDFYSFESTEWKVDNYFMCQTEDGVESGYLNKELFNASKYLVFVVDTSFLDSHGFYTIGAASSENKILKSYVTPNIFVCDTINKFNNERVDGLFCLNQFGKNYYPNFPDDSSNVVPENFNSPSIGVLIENYGGGTGLYPQVFTADENSFSIVKLHFGKLRPAKDIYLTKTTTSALSDFCYYQNMVNEKNSWKEIIREDEFGNKRNFLLGLNSISNSNIDLKSKNNWIPVIEEIKEPLALKFSSDEDFSLFVEHPHWDGVIEYSKDKGRTWVEWNGKRLNGDAEQSIYLRGTGNTVITGHNSTIKNDTYDIFYKWDFTGKYIYGNIETLLDYKTVQKGNHPLMGNSCYRGLFYGCSALREVPELPAIELKDYCYTRMFMKCTSLLTPPKLPSTKLATYCYGNMFFECTSLTKTTKLPATTLAPFCYIGMFQYCYSLVEVPKLPALIMAESCYESMFFGCSILNEVPELPSTTLAKRCYDEMFVWCHALTKMPKLPATSLATECYRYMFFQCSKIKISRTKTSLYQYSYRIPVSGTGTNATNAVNNMFYGTSGSFTGTPSINITYYTSNEVV